MADLSSSVPGGRVSLPSHPARAISYVTVPCALKFGREGHLGGSVVEHLPSAQVVTPESWDRVSHQGPCREPASPSACVSTFLSLCVSHEYINKILKKKNKVQNDHKVLNWDITLE